MAVPKHRTTITVKHIRNNIKQHYLYTRTNCINELTIYNFLAIDNELALGKYNNYISSKLKIRLK